MFKGIEFRAPQVYAPTMAVELTVAIGATVAMGEANEARNNAADHIAKLQGDTDASRKVHGLLVQSHGIGPQKVGVALDAIETQTSQTNKEISTISSHMPDGIPRGEQAGIVGGTALLAAVATAAIASRVYHVRQNRRQDARSNQGIRTKNS